MTERIPAIQQELTKVVDALDDLGAQVTIDEMVLRRTRRTTSVAVVGLIFEVALTVIFGWGLAEVNRDQARVNELQASVQQEADRSRAGQCAVIALFLQFEPKTLANPAYTDEQKALQAQAYATLKNIAQDLECH